MLPVQPAPVYVFATYAVLLMQTICELPAVHAKAVTVVCTGASPPCPQLVDEYEYVRM